MIAFAALNLGIPTAHSQGGDVSGNIDDIIRHAITKIAHIHFPETKNAAKRISKMGEDDWRIHTIGSLYIDRIVREMYTPIKEVQEKYGLEKNEEYFIIIQHPDTFESTETNYQHMQNILEAVRAEGKRAFVLYPCSDPGYEGVMKAIDEIKDNQQFMVFKNIDNLDFLTLLKHAQALIGNSSCASVEAPYFQLPAINIGKRQMGRESEENVVDAQPTVKDIQRKINYVLTNNEYRKQLSGCGYRLGNGTAAEKMLGIIKNLEINKKLLQKRITY